MKLIVSVADMKLSSDPAATFVTHGLGTCLGIAVHDATANVGGLLHVMMPTSSVNPVKAQANPFMFVDTGVPAFLDALKAAGAKQNRWKLKVAGGASTSHDHFGIGKRNWVTLRKMLWKAGILIDAFDVGGSDARTMALDMATGQVGLRHGTRHWEL